MGQIRYGPHVRVQESSSPLDRYHAVLSRFVSTTPGVLITPFHTITRTANARTTKRLRSTTRRLDLVRLHETVRHAGTIQTGLRPTDTQDTTTNQTRRLRILRPNRRTIENRQIKFSRDRTLPCATERRQDLRSRQRRSNRTN